MIIFANEPSVGVYDLEMNQLSWCHQVNEEHELFKIIFSEEDLTYFCLEDFLLIPIGETNTSQELYLEDQLIACPTKKIVICHYQQVHGIIVATSLQLPEYEYFRKYLQ